MAAGYKPPFNYRSAASRTPVPEPFDIVGGVALLAEAPADPGDASTPMVVAVNGSPRTRVTSTPNAGEFMVRTATSPQGTALLPVLEFHAADEGLSGTADYYRTGTVYTAEWFAYLLSFVTPLTGIASKAALDAAYPATADLTQPGRPGRMAFLADFTAWYSDGAAWRQISGTAPVVTAVDALYAATFGVTPDAIASHAGAMAAAFTSGMAADGAWNPPGSFTGAFQAAVTAAAQLDAAWVGGGLAGAIADTFTSNASLDATWAAGGGGGGITRVGVSSVVQVPVSSNANITLPGPVLADDIIVVFTSCNNTPSGFTLKSSITQPFAYVYWKRAAGGETTVTVGTGSGGGNGCGVAVVYRGCIAGAGVDPFDLCFFSGTSNGTSAAGGPTTTIPKDMLAFGAIFHTDDGGSTVPNCSWNDPTGAAVTTLAQWVNPSPNATSGQSGLVLYEAGIIDPAGTVSLTASFAGALTTTKQIRLVSFALKPA